MNKWLAVLIVFYLVAGSVPVVLASPGQDELEEPYLSPGDCLSDINGDCPTEDQQTTIVYDTSVVDAQLNYYGNFGMQVQIVCSEMGCTQIDLWSQITITYTWTSRPSWLEQDGFLSIYYGNPNALHEEVMPCGSGTTGTCSFVWNGYTQGSEISPFFSDTYHFLIFFRFHGTWSVTQDIDYEIKVSTEPINDNPCDAIYSVVNEVSSGDIPASISNGIGLTTDVAQTYMLHIYGGPWNDSLTDRYDVAAKFGTDDWTPLAAIAGSETALCTQNDEEGFGTSLVFKATAATLRLRVNDLEGQFLDNTGSMDYSLSVVEKITTMNCGDQYMQGDLLGTITVMANYSTGYALTTPLLSRVILPANWFTIKVTDGDWHDNGGGELTTLAAAVGSSSSYTSLSNFSYTGCADEVGGTYYIQMPMSGGIKIRVDDQDGNFSNNTGFLTVQIYSALFDRFAYGCELEYTISGSAIDSEYVPANSSLGIDLFGNGHYKFPPMEKGGEGENDKDPQRYYVLDVIGGPFFDGLQQSVYIEMSEDDGVTWYSNLMLLSDAACLIQIDQVGRVRFIFNAEKDRPYRFRASDPGDGYSNNSGRIGYNVYEAYSMQMYDPGVALEPGTCNTQFVKGAAAGGAITLNGVSSVGANIPYYSPGAIIALQTTNGPWTNNGANSYEIAISDDNGATYYQINEYPYILCAQSDDGTHVLAYIQAAEGKHYKLRVNDEGGNFADNGGTITVTPYAATTYIDPWHSCDDQYTVTQVAIPVDQTKIPVYSSGSLIPYITDGGLYAIDASINSYTVNGVESYLAEMSADNGATWVDMPDADQGGSPISTCVVLLGDGDEMVRVYFTANGTYKLRANAGGTHQDGDYIQYILYSAVNNDATPEPGEDAPGGIYLPPEWGTACYESCPQAPYHISTTAVSFGTLGSVNFPDIGGFIAGWISSSACSMQKFFAVCPEHWQAIAQLPTLLNDYEPFGSFIEVSDGIAEIKSQLETMGYGGENETRYTPYSVIYNESGGEEGGNFWDGLTPILPTTSIWNGGEINLTLEGGGELAHDNGYKEMCIRTFEPFMGGMIAGFCPVLTIAHGLTTVWVGLQLMLDLAGIMMLIKYIKRAWIDTGAAG